MLIGKGEGRGQSVHLIGIGGSGMNAVARLLLQSGYAVSGSDARHSKHIEDLEALGARVAVGHHAEHINGASMVIASPAIPPANDELRAARKAGLRIISRAEALSAMLGEKQVICIAGSHGKTTTTAMLTHILNEAGYEPGFYVGGRVPALGGEVAQVGKGKYFVMEACEAFRALDYWRPRHCIITNITDEHIEHYDGLQGLQDGFAELAGRVGAEGILAICGDDEDAVNVARFPGRRAEKFGLVGRNSVTANIIHSSDEFSEFKLIKEGRILGEVRLPIPGRHNVYNALAAISVALGLKVEWSIISEALSTFTGVARRWQCIGEERGIRVFDDYAHHPVEISATLKIAKSTVTAGGRLVVIFEPQLLSRVARLKEKLGEALSVADLVLLAPIDAAGESSISVGGVDTMIFAIESRGCETARLESIENAALHASRYLRDGDVVVTMGPGQVGHVGEDLLGLLRSYPEDSMAAADCRLVLENSSIVSGPVVKPHATTILDRIDAQVLRNPYAAAISMPGAQLNYAELWKVSGILSHYLGNKGCMPQQVIAVCLNNAVHRIQAFLAILRAGCIYLPIDPRLPDARIQHMLRDSSASCVLLENETADSIVGNDLQVIKLDQIGIGKDDAVPALPPVLAHQAAYIIYTSGTTGLPKGSQISHLALCNLASDCVDTFDIRVESRVLQASAFGFDVAIGDMVMALCGGACLVCPVSDFERIGSPLATLIGNARVTHISMTPSALAVMPQRKFPALTHVIVAGEECPAALVDLWSQGRRFFNAYGPTEATIYASIAECRHGEEVTIGRPIRNVEAIVLNKKGVPVEVGVNGELWLGGVGLARGYLNRPALSGKCFKNFHVNGLNSTRWYRTFDEVCLLEGGQLKYFGRMDNQVKLRGVRIELGEIEALLRQHPNVANAVAGIRPDAAGRDQLVAWVLYCVGTEDTGCINLQEFLSGHLPAYMMPSAFTQVRSIPRSLNGKMDRAALPDPVVFPPGRDKDVAAPSNQVEQSIHDIFCDELPFLREIGIREVFSDVGIDSLSVAILLLEVEKHFAIEISGEVMAGANTIELLALHVQHLIEPNSSFETQATDVDQGFQDELQSDLAKWHGHRRSPDAWIFSRHQDASSTPLFWCATGFLPVNQLARHLGPDQPIHGMLAGHKLIEAGFDVTFNALARLYFNEIIAIQPEGPIQIGGNCAGGTLAREIALLLQATGRVVSILIMVEQGRFPAYNGRVALFFGVDSYANPCARLADPERIMKAAYPGGHSIHIVSGRHGQLFAHRNSGQVSAVVRELLDKLCE